MSIDMGKRIVHCWYWKWTSYYMVWIFSLMRIRMIIVPRDRVEWLPLLDHQNLTSMVGCQYY